MYVALEEPPIVHPWWNKEDQEAYLEAHDRFAATLPPVKMGQPKGTLASRIHLRAPVIYKSISLRQNKRCCMHGITSGGRCSYCLSYGRCIKHELPTALCFECSYSICKHGYLFERCVWCNKECPVSKLKVRLCLHCMEEEWALPLELQHTPILPHLPKQRTEGRIYRARDPATREWVRYKWERGVLSSLTWVFVNES